MHNMFLENDYKDILVAYDGSDSSRNALDQAVSFARATGAQLSAVSALIPPPTWLDPELRVHMEEEIEHQNELVTFIDKGRKAQGYPNIELVEVQTTIHETIIAAAQSKGASLIVMGRRGLNPIARILVGSVTARVIGYSPIDILVVPLGVDFRWGRVLLAADGSKHSEAAARRAFGLAQAYGTELKVVHVIDAPAELYANDSKMRDSLEREARKVIEPIEREAGHLNINVEGFIEAGIAPLSILRLAKSISADFIIIGSHGRTGIERFLMGSVAERVIANDTHPVLVVKSGFGLSG